MLGDFLEKWKHDDYMILTANSRLARYLHTAYQHHQEKKNQHAWITPTILPLSVWLAQCFHTINTEGKILLTDFQELCLWEKIIRSSSLMPNLWQPGKTAELLQQAWQFLTLWQVPDAILQEHATHIESQCLLEWMLTFRAALKEKQAITISELPRYLKQEFRTLRNSPYAMGVSQGGESRFSPLSASANLVRATHLLQEGVSTKCETPVKEQDEKKPPSTHYHIALIGFDDLPPAHQDLFSQLKKHVSLEMIDAEKHDTPEIMRLALPDSETELNTMANWAKTEWQKNPTAKIGCIIAELSNQLHRVKRVFSDVFYMDVIDPQHNPHPPFNISVGMRLDQYEMIKMALTILSWSQNALEITSLGNLLQSPFLALDESDISMGAQIDIQLRELNFLTVSRKELFQVIPSLQPWYSNTTWIARLRAFNKISDTLPQKLLPSQWIEQFIAMLQAWQWPGEKTQSSELFQLTERFKKMCLEYSQYDFIFSNISFDQALSLFKSLVKKTIFQPKSHREPIQIMGMLEAGGITFDAIWVMGLHDGVWPAPTQFNPFIPIAIQKKFQMPHATPERELQFCHHITERLKNSAKQVIFSSPMQEKEIMLRPSRFIESIPLIDLAALQLTAQKNVIEKIFDSKKIEIIEDHLAPIVSHAETILGGNHILKLQAQCPFRAFASIRLRAKPFLTPMLGISPMKKGIFIHEILFHIWQQLKDQATLNHLSEGELETLIDDIILKVLEKETQYSIHHDYFFEIEKKRLKKMVLHWMIFEKSRPYFKVLALESSQAMTLSSLSLQIRQDRVDELSDGSQLLIDYKTGKTTTKSWFDERLTEPQLPLYAICQQAQITPITGVGLAEIRSGKIALKGIVSENHLYANASFSEMASIRDTQNKENITDWKTLIEKWKQSLHHIAKQFCDGEARVDPVEKKTCDTCHLQTLCRIKI